ncbi:MULTISPECIES: hypothetical protein [unclassified Raoultella]|uniref:hypothetical protein n=3 Tax=unclassified Raoultella TaxID=2627600 RepID=UPI001358BD62|nr:MULTISPECIES: hypothetical protein [unclassified Raoultella]
MKPVSCVIFWLARWGSGSVTGYETVATFPPGIKKSRGCGTDRISGFHWLSAKDIVFEHAEIGCHNNPLGKSMGNDKFLYQLKIGAERADLDQVADQVLGLKVAVGLIFRQLSEESKREVLRQMDSLQHPSVLKAKEDLKQFIGN